MPSLPKSRDSTLHLGLCADLTDVQQSYCHIELCAACKQHDVAVVPDSSERQHACMPPATAHVKQAHKYYLHTFKVRPSLAKLLAPCDIQPDHQLAAMT